MHPLRCKALVLNAPEIFADPAFQCWLQNGGRKFTWYQGGPVDEWSDTVVLVDPSLNGEGSDSDMPHGAWTAILAACQFLYGSDPEASFCIMVRLTNFAV